MDRGSARKRKHLKIVLAALIVGALGIVSAVFLGEKRAPENHAVAVPESGENANISIGGIHQTSSKNGITEWRLDAGSASYFDDGKQLVLRSISAIFYYEGDREIRLASERGTMNADSKNINVRENVVISSENYNMKAETVRYDHNRKMFTSELPVTFTGPEFVMSADSMTLDITSNKIVLKGNVNGAFSEKIKL